MPHTLLLLALLACSKERVAPPPVDAQVPSQPQPAAPVVPSVGKLLDAPNLEVMQTTWGFVLSPAELRYLAEHGFLVKPLPETGIRPEMWRDNDREFIALYRAIRGPEENFRDRSQANTVYLSADVFLHVFNLLYTEILKEIEIKHFQPALADLCRVLYEDAATRANLPAEATSAVSTTTWRKVRNYFAVPHALLGSNALDGRTPEGDDPQSFETSRLAIDKSIDTFESSSAFVRNLALDAESEADVLNDLKRVFAAKGRGAPGVLEQEYAAYAAESGLNFEVDFTQFTPRSHYTTSADRRQYFRAMMWFSNVPFFLGSAQLTAEARAAASLLGAHEAQLKDYTGMDRAIGFMVGSSNDLTPLDYLEVARTGGDLRALARSQRIKGTPVTYASVGRESSDDVLDATAGMRFFSQRFILDGWWTSQLTQGDEAPRPGYPAKLPPMASSLQVMSLLGSSYARNHLSDLDFYKPPVSVSIDMALRELASQEAAIPPDFWTDNMYNGWLNTLKAVLTPPVGKVPAFMGSAPWGAKTLMTASGSWTELRHATLLYAMQSFAEMGGGGPSCDSRPIPPPPRGYVEPLPLVYERLAGLTTRLEETLRAQGFDDVSNFGALQEYGKALQMAGSYAEKELKDATLSEKVIEVRQEWEDEDGKPCVEQQIEGKSDWETLRVQIIAQLDLALPYSVEGPVLPMKDKRVALVADVHTGGDSENPTRVLYEGTGVPNAILVAVNDANGPRLAIGFTYSHYEFTEPHGDRRLTDEDWQRRFYDDQGYKPVSAWPAPNPWYGILYERTP